MKAYLANRREGNASTKTRAEVTLSKRKVYRQKGTGRARVGTAGSPIRVGGGVAHGPKPRNFRERVPKKVKRLALKSALTLKVAEGGLKVLEDFLLEAPKTKRMADMLRAIQADGPKGPPLDGSGRTGCGQVVPESAGSVCAAGSSGFYLRCGQGRYGYLYTGSAGPAAGLMEGLVKKDARKIIPSATDYRAGRSTPGKAQQTGA